jgi:hypothetical protein
MDERDKWFEEKKKKIEKLEMKLRKINKSVENLVENRRDMEIIN